MNFTYFFAGILIYFILISAVSIAATVSDKKRAENGRYRIRESTLMLLSALGGSFFMYITMKKIRHKTKHLKFMAGIPVIMVLQIGLVFFLIYCYFMNRR